MPRSPKGYFFRREPKTNRYLSIDSENKDATIYYCIQSDSERRAVCMFTSSMRVAKKRAETLGLTITETAGDYERYLRGLVKLGKKAEKELEKLL